GGLDLRPPPLRGPGALRSRHDGPVRWAGPAVGRGGPGRRSRLAIRRLGTEPGGDPGAVRESEARPAREAIEGPISPARRASTLTARTITGARRRGQARGAGELGSAASGSRGCRIRGVADPRTLAQVGLNRLVCPQGVKVPAFLDAAAGKAVEPLPRVVLP